ncbi:NUP-domain-containing protein [Gymnopus androsaceus JB14]|uniref:NUP-domain-containing protein n=1 Tax=Gymnopus androsaceus JB14 TaxID=1447944 RepID=A0A6A4HMA9_9AGAR|nr:NUP-domain-containing protein [Gymnopus androsaceus JB14]
MRSYHNLASFILVVVVAYLLTPVCGKPVTNHSKGHHVIKPKVFIIDMRVKSGLASPNLISSHKTSPSPASPLSSQDAHCTSDGSICQLITGEAEINAASTMTALVYSGVFDLTTTYFLIAGIAGINPKVATIGSVTFARFAVQAMFRRALLLQIQYPQSIYGTEVFELNSDLRTIAVNFAKTATLNDSVAAQEQRVLYASVPAYARGAAAPTVTECDTATSDVYWSGDLLGEAFENTTLLFTNGTGLYCSSQQEDNATLEALLRATLVGLVDFSRIIVMRTASDFDREYNGETAAANLFGEHPAFRPSVMNLYLAGVKVIEGILNGWKEQFEQGIKPTNYIGDIFGTLGGEPDFGPGSIFGGHPATPASALARRSVRQRSKMMKRF